jgi:hypothetical protein
VLATAGVGNDGYYGAGIRGVADPEGWGVDGIGNVAGVRGTSDEGPGVLGESSGLGVAAIVGLHLAGGYGISAAGGGPSRTFPPAFYADNSARPRGWAGVFHGDVWVTGSLVKSGGGFSIDMPGPEAPNSILNHSFVESPDMMNVYNGNVAQPGFPLPAHGHRAVCSGDRGRGDKRQPLRDQD